MIGASVSGDENGIPVFVMLPLDILNYKHEVHYGDSTNEDDSVRELTKDLKTLKSKKVKGVMVDCWWGRVEAEGPGQYNWKGYDRLFSIVCSAGLDLHVVMSFHANGDDNPLPNWVKRIGETEDLFYKDADGRQSSEYLSWAVDQELVLKDRYGNPVSPLQVYENFMSKFRESMSKYFKGSDETPGRITMIEVGLGPSGELRYPAYRLNSPPITEGIGAFQCYDKYMMESWKNAATHQGLQIPRRVGPQTAGKYDSKPEETLFFREQPETSFIYGPHYRDDYGKSFLTWYAENLVAHGNRVLQIAKDVFQNSEVGIAAKVPGIHWYCNTEGRAAEATAGLFTDHDDKLSVYGSIAATLKRLQATFIFTCAEMKDDSNNETDRPHELVTQVLGKAELKGASIACENGSEAYDEGSYNRIFDVATTYNISYFTYMRLCPKLMTNFGAFDDFVKKMKGT